MSDYLDTLDPQRVASACDQVRAHAPELIDQAGGSIRLAVYLVMVDRHLRSMTGGLGHRDLVDHLWADAMSDGISPREAAEAAMEADGIFG